MKKIPRKIWYLPYSRIAKHSPDEEELKTCTRALCYGTFCDKILKLQCSASILLGQFCVWNLALVTSRTYFNCLWRLWFQLFKYHVIWTLYSFLRKTQETKQIFHAMNKSVLHLWQWLSSCLTQSQTGFNTKRKDLQRSTYSLKDIYIIWDRRQTRRRCQK